MNCVYLANVVIDPADVADRDPVCAEAGRLRAVEMLGVLSGSLLFENIYLISQGRGRKRGRYSLCTREKKGYTAVYLPIWSHGMFLCNLSAILFATMWLIRNVRRHDVVIAYNCDPMKAIAILLTWPVLRFKLIVQYEELYAGLGAKYRLHRVFERLGARVADGFIVSNMGVVKSLQLKTASDRLAVASGYVPAYSQVVTEPSRGGTGALRLLYAGNLDEARGIKELVRSFVAIQHAATLLITGRGVLQSHIEDLASRHRNVVYLGMLPEGEFARVIGDVDACVNPQPTDHAFSDASFPSKVVNYLAHGKIVLTTPSVAIANSPYKDMVIVYDDKDDESLRAALNRVTCEKHALSAKACEYAHRVREIKEQEAEDVRRVLRCVSDAS